jgi:hypothetical protein
VTATASEISYLDPVIPDKEVYLFRPGHIDMKVCKKGSGNWPSLLYFMMTHKILPFRIIHPGSRRPRPLAVEECAIV